jgi:DNA-binding transcriptional LysR family regulator
MRFDLLSLKLFVAVCEHSSIARAAETNHIAASAVSKRMSDLEGMLKAPLFFRHPKGLELTDTARALLHHARILLRDLHQMEAELGEHGKGVRGKVRIAASVSTIVQHLPRDLGRFLAEHSDVTIELEEGLSQDVVRAVADNAADIGVFGGSLPTPGLTVLNYRTDRLVVLMRAEHPLAGVERLSFAAAARHDLVGPQKGSFLDSLVLRAAADLSEALRLRIRVNGFETAASMVEAGLGIALVPENLAARYTAGGGLVAVQLDEDWAIREWKLCIRDVESLPPPAQLLVQHLTPDAVDARWRLRRRA